MPSKILFLDDDQLRCRRFRGFLPSADIVNTAAAAIEVLRNGIASNHRWETVCLDHDLGGRVYVHESEEETGSGVVRFIAACEVRPQVGTFIVHSLNFPAAASMLSALRSLGYTAMAIPFPNLTTHQHWSNVTD